MQLYNVTFSNGDVMQERGDSFEGIKTFLESSYPCKGKVIAIAKAG